MLRLFNQLKKLYQNDTNKRIIIITLIAVVLIYTFMESVNKDMERTVSVTPTNLMAISIAISEAKYGLTGYTGYTNLLKIFLRDLSLFPASRDDIYNSKIKEALDYGKYNDPKSGGLHLIWNDVGMVTYFKLAFKLFGYKIQSVFYLYFLLLLVSIYTFVVTFRKQIRLLSILLLFVCSHFVVVMATATVGGELQVSNARFFPVLAIVPSFYLTLLALGKHKINLLTLSGTIIQTFILILIIYARSSAIYQLVFLPSILFIAFIWYWKETKKIKEALKSIQFLPLAIVFFAFFLLKLHLMTGLHHSYDTARHKHHFWGAALVGLSAHPDSESKYGITFSDNSYYKAIQRRAIELGHSFDPNIDILKSVQIDHVNRDDFIYTNGLKSHRSTLSNFSGGQSGNCLQITSSDHNLGYAYFSIPTQVGRKYKISGHYKKGTAANGQIKVGTSIDATDLCYSGPLYGVDWEKYNGVFIATRPVTYITLVSLTSKIGQTSFFDNINIIFDKDVLSRKNIIPNGEFTLGTIGVIPYMSNLLSVHDGESGSCLQITSSEPSRAYAYFITPTQVGRKYKISGYYKKGTAANGQIKVGTSVDATNLYYSGTPSNTDWKEYSGVFTATSPITYITLVNLTSRRGDTSLFDTVRLEPVSDDKEEIVAYLFDQHLGNAKKEIKYISLASDSFARYEFLKILKSDPLFVLESYFCKIPLFFKVFFSSSGHEYYHFGITGYLFTVPILMMIFLGFLLVREYFDKTWFLYSGILVFQFMCTLLPPIFFIPVSHHISESGLLLTVIIYMIFSVVSCYALNKLLRAYPTPTD